MRMMVQQNKAENDGSSGNHTSTSVEMTFSQTDRFKKDGIIN